MSRGRGVPGRGWVWVDFENTPHVLFFEPIIGRLRDDGWEVRISAKPQAQTLALAAARRVAVQAVGAGDFEGRWGKVLGGLGRAADLTRWVTRGKRPAVLVCSSRSAAMAALLMRVPVVGLLDYEHAEHRPLSLASRMIWLPDILSRVRLPRRVRRLARFYPGLKENLYLDHERFDREAERAALGLDSMVRLIVTRPPATTAHYAARDNYQLWHAAVRGLASRPDAHLVIVPRTPGQAEQITADVTGLARVTVLREVVSGPALIAAADLVLGGGGTMNREAAVLGVPAWSVFMGPTPAIDEQLAQEGRLRWIRSEAELTTALRDEIPPRRSGRGPFPDGLAAISGAIEDLLNARRFAPA